MLTPRMASPQMGPFPVMYRIHAALARAITFVDRPFSRNSSTYLGGGGLTRQASHSHLMSWVDLHME